MEIKEYKVIVDIFTVDGEAIMTGWIEGIKGTVVQCSSIPEVFTELGVHLRILDEIKKMKK
jgi:hypothetical protein